MYTETLNCLNVKIRISLFWLQTLGRTSKEVHSGVAGNTKFYPIFHVLLFHFLNSFKFDSALTKRLFYANLEFYIVFHEYFTKTCHYNGTKIVKVMRSQFDWLNTSGQPITAAAITCYPSIGKPLPIIVMEHALNPIFAFGKSICGPCHAYLQNITAMHA